MKLPPIERVELLTAVLIITTAVLAGLYDLVIVVIYGGPATISTAIGKWLMIPILGGSIAYGLAFLCGHFIGMTGSTKRYIALLSGIMFVGFLSGLIITLRS